jgi:hypothetical protein
MKQSIGISLGWNCYSASHGVRTGLRSTKADGYTTCPFDEAISNYEGVVRCIRDDFKHFMHLKLIEVPEDSPYMANETLIYNPHYKFIFNHESPGHANLWKTQEWVGGKAHYIKDDYMLFKERYTRRIRNFRDYLNSGKHIDFIITKEHADFHELESLLKDKYPNLMYTIHRLDLELGKDHYYAHLNLMLSGATM